MCLLVVSSRAVHCTRSMILSSVFTFYKRLLKISCESHSFGVSKHTHPEVNTVLQRKPIDISLREHCCCFISYQVCECSSKGVFNEKSIDFHPLSRHKHPHCVNPPPPPTHNHRVNTGAQIFYPGIGTVLMYLQKNKFMNKLKKFTYLLLRWYEVILIFK